MSQRAASPPAIDRLAVVILPFAAERAFRVVLGALAAQAGYACRDESGLIGDITANLEPKVLLVCSDASLLSRVAIDRAVVITEPAVSAAQGASILYGLDRRNSVITASKWLAFASAFQAKPGVTAMALSELAQDPAEAVARLAEALGLTIRPKELSVQMGGLAAELAGMKRGRLESEPVLAVHDNPDLPVEWDRGLFWSADRADRTCPDPIDLTGRARALFYGPFFTLPPGRWRATIRLSFSPEAARRPFRLDLSDGDYPLVEKAFWPADGGDYEIELVAYWPAPAAIQLRLWMTAACFDGEAILHGVTLRREPPAAAAPSIDPPLPGAIT